MLKSAVIGSGGAGRNMLSSLMGKGIPLYLMNSSKDPRFSQIFSLDREIIASISTDKSVKRQLMETERSALTVLSKYDVTFSVSGLGGFYGTAVPIMLSRLSKDIIPIFTLPFSIEGEKRRRTAEKGMKEILSSSVWAIALENDRLLKIAPNATLDGAFRAMNLLVSEIIVALTVAFDDSDSIKRALKGRVGAGIGTGEGMNRQEKALRDALSSPWLNMGKKAIIVVKGGRFEDFQWIKQEIEDMGSEISAESYIPGKERLELLIIS